MTKGLIFDAFSNEGVKLGVAAGFSGPACLQIERGLTWFHPEGADGVLWEVSVAHYQPVDCVSGATT